MIKDSYEMCVNGDDVIVIPIVAWSDMTMGIWAESWAMTAPKGGFVALPAQESTPAVATICHSSMSGTVGSRSSKLSDLGSAEKPDDRPADRERAAMDTF